jgi:hypothetical protein
LREANVARRLGGCLAGVPARRAGSNTETGDFNSAVGAEGETPLATAGKMPALPVVKC